MGKLIVIEGVDSSGKETQSRQLVDRLQENGIRAKFISFPNYESDSSALVKMYLGGQFGTHPNDVNPYAASSFYAVDRYASFRSDWHTDYENGTVIVCDRYIPSNMIHQAVKLDNLTDKNAFLDWLSRYEYEQMGLPKENITFFLDVPTEVREFLIRDRANKITGNQEKDIHESDRAYQEKAYENAKYIAEKYHFQLISCTKDGVMRSVASIGDEIFENVMAVLKE